jgi:GNAT superfamily N-acetyltransferase
MRIRRAAPAELPALQDIERAAGEPFRALGMATVADDEPPALEMLERFRRAGRAWVALDGQDDDGDPVAYLLSATVDGAEYIEQVSVHPRAARRGVGRLLIEHTAERARAGGLPSLTLSTFAEVPWNAPYYARLGFHILDEAQLTPGLRKIRAAEAEHGLDRWPRVCMRRPV